MIKFIRHFFKSTAGAVTVDWIILTTAVVGLGIAAIIGTRDGTAQMSDDIDTFLETDTRFIQNR